MTSRLIRAAINRSRTTLLVMAGFAVLLGLRDHPAWRGVAAAAVVLVASLTMRTLDDQTGAVCAAMPSGTHWGWHVLNGTLLGLLIVTFIRHGERPETEAEIGAETGA